MNRRSFLKYGMAGFACLALPNLSDSSIFSEVRSHDAVDLVILTAGAGNGQGRRITRDDASIHFIYNDGNKNPVTHSMKRIVFPNHYLYSYTRQAERFGMGHGAYTYGGGVRAEFGEDYREVRKRIVDMVNQNL